MAPRVIRPTPIEHLHGEWGYMIWSRIHDERFMKELNFARKFVPLHCVEVHVPVLQVISSILSDHFGHAYNVPFLKELFYKLREKYELFRYVVGFPHVVYDPETGSINMPADTTAALRYLRPLAERYMLRGEPLWKELKLMFEEPELFVYEERVVHPDNKIEKIVFESIPKNVKDEDDEGRRIPAYCRIYNDIYRTT